MPTRLPDTHIPHSPRNIFQPQSDSATAQQPQGGVRQDKNAPSRVRIASTQPVTPKNTTRTHQMNTRSSRSQKRSTKRKTVYGMIWMPPALKADIQKIAEQEGLSFSQTGKALLEEAVRQKLHIRHAVLLQPIIETTIRKEIRTISTRLALLLARGAYESGQTKRLVVHVLKRYGVNQAMLKAMLEDSSRGARTTLLRKTPQIETVLAEVAAWLEETDTEG